MRACVVQLSRVKYCVMTNIPFDKEEASHWRPQRKHYSSRFKSALRVDPLLKGGWVRLTHDRGGSNHHDTGRGGQETDASGGLWRGPAGDWETVEACLKAAGYELVSRRPDDDAHRHRAWLLTNAMTGGCCCCCPCCARAWRARSSTCGTG